MSDQDGVPPSTSDLELDLILQTASNDLAEGIARVTDVAAGAQAIASREAAPPCMSDTELDAALDLKCSKCRFANANEANFCRNCGTPLRNITAIPKTEEVALR